MTPNFSFRALKKGYGLKKKIELYLIPEMAVEFLAPDGFSLKRTSLDLLWAVEHVLL